MTGTVSAVRQNYTVVVDVTHAPFRATAQFAGDIQTVVINGGGPISLDRLIGFEF